MTITMALAAAPPIAAQASPQAVGTATLLSLAGGLTAGTPDFGGHGTLSVSHRVGDVIVRFADTSDFTIFGLAESVRDISLLYGRRSRGERGWVRAAAGLGYVRYLGEELQDVCSPTLCTSEQVPNTTLGFAVQLDGVWALSRLFGLGVGVIGNLNGQRSMGAATLSVHLGRMR